jgi:hypothetical protein
MPKLDHKGDHGAMKERGDGEGYCAVSLHGRAAVIGRARLLLRQ